METHMHTQLLFKWSLVLSYGPFSFQTVHSLNRVLTEMERRNNCFIAPFEAGPSIRLPCVLHWMCIMCEWGSSDDGDRRREVAVYVDCLELRIELHVHVCFFPLCAKRGAYSDRKSLSFSFSGVILHNHLILPAQFVCHWLCGWHLSNF